MAALGVTTLSTAPRSPQQTLTKSYNFIFFNFPLCCLVTLDACAGAPSLITINVPITVGISLGSSVEVMSGFMRRYYQCVVDHGTSLITSEAAVYGDTLH